MCAIWRGTARGTSVALTTNVTRSLEQHMKKHLLGALTTVITLAAAFGCGSSRDVKVSGTIAGDTNQAAGAPIRLEFYEPSGGADAGTATPAEMKLVDSVTLDAIGHFERTVSMDGNELYVVAVADADKSDACSDGESWGESVTRVAADDTASVVLSIAPQAKCPAFASK